MGRGGGGGGFFFNDTATTEIYTLSLHDALPIYYMRHVTWELAYRRAISDVDLASRLTNIESLSRNEIYNHHLNFKQHGNCQLLQKFSYKIVREKSDSSMYGMGHQFGNLRYSLLMGPVCKLADFLISFFLKRDSLFKEFLLESGAFLFVFSV